MRSTMQLGKVASSESPALRARPSRKRAPLPFPDVSRDFTGLKVSVFLEVEGAAHYLPAYAGNLDIMTSAALRTAERVASNLRREIAA